MTRIDTWRIPIRVNVKVNCGDRVYSGTLTNLSEKGMFITTDRICDVFNSELRVSIPMKEKTIQVPVKLVWIEKEGPSHEGLGVELINPPKEYLEFVDDLIYSL